MTITAKDTDPTTARARQWSLATLVTAAASAATLLASYITAGQLFKNEDFEELHGTAAIVLHVTTGLLAVAAAGYFLAAKRAVWIPIVSVITFAATFLQAYWGKGSTLWIHVPSALVVTTAIIVLLVASVGLVRAPRGSVPVA